jgi:hypothetical protein
MTGAYLLAVRDGKRQPVEVEHLTDAERESKLANDPNLMAWVHMLCKELVEAERLIRKVKE